MHHEEHRQKWLRFPYMSARFIEESLPHLLDLPQHHRAKVLRQLHQHGLPLPDSDLGLAEDRKGVAALQRARSLRERRQQTGAT
jgi:phage-related protein